MFSVLSGVAEWIEIEPLVNGEGVEFLVGAAGEVEAHQVKLQNGIQTSWTLSALEAESIWSSAASHVAAHRKFVFVSSTPAPLAQELAQRARRSDDVDRFVLGQLTSQKLVEGFTAVSTALGSSTVAWETLRGCEFRTIDPAQLVTDNLTLSRVLISGEGRLTSAALQDIALHELGVPLDRGRLIRRLNKSGLSAAGGRTPSLDAESHATSWSQAVVAQMFEPGIERTEANEILAAVSHSKITFLVGDAGSGKSVVAQQVTRRLQAADVAVLPLRLDRIEDWSTTSSVGAALGLTESPVATLGAAAAGRECLLVIEQADAVSLVSGRAPEGFDRLLDLLVEAGAFPQMRVVIVCRSFDLENDSRLRQLDKGDATPTVVMRQLEEEQVASVLRACEVDPDALSATQREILRAPINLTMYLNARMSGLGWNSDHELLEAFWDAKRREVEARRRGTRFVDVVDLLASKIAASRRLAVHAHIFDEGALAADADVLVSERVLVRDGPLVGFFHESFFDYSFARRWVRQGRPLEELLRADQGLFVRGQLRQVLTHLRFVDRAAYNQEMRLVLFSGWVRFHLKQAAISVLIDDRQPGDDELGLLLLALADDDLQVRCSPAWGMYRWAELLDRRGLLDRWLSARDPNGQRALVAHAFENPARAVQLIRAMKPDERLHAIRSVLHAEPFLKETRARRLVLTAAEQGVLFEDTAQAWWLLVHQVADTEIGLAVLRGYLLGALSDERTDSLGRVAALAAHDDGLDDFAQWLAEQRPREFATLTLPFIDALGRVADDYGFSQSPDPSFVSGFVNAHSRDSRGEAIWESTLSALVRLGQQDPAEVLSLLEPFVGTRNTDLLTLIAKVYTSAPQHFHSESSELLRGNALVLTLGYYDSPVWISRDLLAASIRFFSDSDLSEIEDLVRDLNLPGQRRPNGRFAYDLLSAIPEGRLSQTGARRLAEYQRKFGATPRPPRGIFSYSVESPIDADRADRMNDRHWLNAMRRYKEEERVALERGGLHELGQVLRAQTVKDPARFARLALRIDDSINPAYLADILLGLGESTTIDDPNEVFRAVRWSAERRAPAVDRWLGFALQKVREDVPDDLVSTLADRAVTSSDPAPGDDGIRIRSSTEDGATISDVVTSGLNTARGSLCEALAGLIYANLGSRRAELCLGAMAELARDPALPVRVMASELVRAVMRTHPDDAAKTANEMLDHHPEMLAFGPVQSLCLAWGYVDADRVMEVCLRATESPNPKTRIGAAIVVAFGALEWNREDALRWLLLNADEETSEAVARVCAARVVVADNPQLASESLGQLFHHSSAEVRNAAASFVRSVDADSFLRASGLIRDLLDSPAASSDLHGTIRLLSQARERVDDLVVALTVAVTNQVEEGPSLRGFEAAELAAVILRGLAQRGSGDDSSALLDALDELLKHPSYGLDEALARSER
ncbi:ATP-binding protein [Schumannella sp. 10F1B-5-1]|uniref:ATP-binding protein n=1 Tax=Schumannella sp. 10F1B-5-1 TaxID=2590780 RepID=UPI001131D293|nr:ATP-binding protein [Schumannella sp. 10F1B-5-1]TPW71655.1 ATP-binding protein [Schumannella sp. 10F1B-5-1]